MAGGKGGGRRLRAAAAGNALGTLVGDNFCARQRLHADRWPEGVHEVRDGVLLVRLPGAEQLQTAFATGFAKRPVDTARAWYGDDAFSLWLPPGVSTDGAVVTEEVAGMAADLVSTPLVGSADPKLRIEVVDRPELRDDYIAVVVGFAIPPDTIAQLFPLELFTAPGATGFVGYVDDAPVTCCWTLRTGDVVGLYGVMTAASHRRRGLLRELVARATGDARAAGCRHAVTQTATAAFAFGQLGFREVTRYIVVTAAAGSTPHPSRL
jgi:GNAT superfamily N-acetyltransferase